MRVSDAPEGTEVPPLSDILSFVAERTTAGMS